MTTPHAITPVILQASHRFASGGFADIFLDRTSARVYKLFKRIYAENHDSPPDYDILSRAVCDSEITAYTLLQNYPDLASHAPSFFGHTRVGDVVSDRGVSLLDQYLPDCCYCMARIDGADEKLFASGIIQSPHLTTLVEAFVRVGVAYVLDSSVFFKDDPARARLIDFGVEDRHTRIGDEIAVYGGALPATRSRWSVTLGTHTCGRPIFAAATS